MNKKSYLDFLYYRIGKQRYNYRLCSLRKTDDKTISSKWKRYSEIIFPLDFDEDYMIDQINTREILPNEVVIDLEEADKINSIISKLNEDRLNFYVFSTGSRGFHIHLFFDEELSNSEKLIIIERYGGDKQKSFNGTTIALEWARHWKTGNIKELYYNGLSN